MNVYDFNKAAYHTLPKMDREDIEYAIGIVADYLENHKATYYMMLCNDLRYYTIYTWHGTPHYKRMASEMIDVARSLGKLKSIEANDNGAIEFWISNDEECNMYVVFDYDKGVIKV